MALLALRQLTVRFGGLTAVNRVDLDVAPGQIFALIGPNGAGKTTVFNAITGIYAPAGGTIHCAGHDLRRPFRWTVLAAALATGLLTGVAAALLAVNIDSLWRTVIVLHAADPGEPFPLRTAARDGLAHIRAGIVAERQQNRLTELVVLPRGDRHVIADRGRKLPLESHADPATAERRLETVTALVNLCGSLRTTRRAAGEWLVATPDGDYLGLHPSKDDAQRQADRVRALPEAALVARGEGYALVAGDRPLATFSQRYEAEDYQAAMAFARDAAVISADGRWVTFADDRRTVLALFDSHAAAQAGLQQLAIDAGKLRWRLVSRAAAMPLGFAQTPAEAAAMIRDLQARIDRRETAPLAQVRAAQRRARASVWTSLLLGFALGTGGSLAVWSRARRTTDHITRHGIARTFQNIRLFPQMLAIENVLLGLDSRRRAPAWQIALGLRQARAAEADARHAAAEILAFVGLREQAGKLASSLAYGHQRRLEIARALATAPRLLLLDEPAAGMNPSETLALMDLIRRIRDRGVTVLLIEHDMQVVMGISDRIAVLQDGAKIAEGTPHDIQRDPRVIEAYLGREEPA